MTKLYYVIGASGVGKDSLLRYVRGRLSEEQNIAFAHRYITRPAAAGGENHVELSEAEFRQRLAVGCFSMSWQSHGVFYGVGQEINQWMALGLSVVVNGSRAYLAKALQNYPNLTPILITASEQQLRSRLLQRGREQGQALESRLQRASRLDAQMRHERLIRIDNSGELEIASCELLEILTRDSIPVCV